MGELSRRGFLGGLFAAVAAAATAELDPERLFWVPGAKTIFLPPEKTLLVPAQTIFTARTLEEAIDVGLRAVYPDGTVHEARIGAIGGFPKRLTHDDAVAAWISDVKQAGGRVVENHAYVTRNMGARVLNG